MQTGSTSNSRPNATAFKPASDVTTQDANGIGQQEQRRHEAPQGQPEARGALSSSAGSAAQRTKVAVPALRTAHDMGFIGGLPRDQHLAQQTVVVVTAPKPEIGFIAGLPQDQHLQQVGADRRLALTTVANGLGVPITDVVRLALDPTHDLKNLAALGLTQDEIAAMADKPSLTTAPLGLTPTQLIELLKSPDPVTAFSIQLSDARKSHDSEKTQPQV
jgi:hypothetical protein